MTLEKYIGFSADDWDKLSQTELDEFTKRYHHITKPDKTFIKESIIANKPKKIKSEFQSELKNITALAQKLGINFKT